MPGGLENRDKSRFKASSLSATWITPVFAEECSQRKAIYLTPYFSLVTGPYLPTAYSRWFRLRWFGIRFCARSMVRVNRIWKAAA